MLKKFLKILSYIYYQFFVSNFFLIPITFKRLLLIYKKNFYVSQYYIRNKFDFNTLLQIFIKEEYIFNNNIQNLIIKKYDEILVKKKIPLIFDCGSNIGASTNFFSLIYPKSELIALEPDIENIMLCKKNFIKKFAFYDQPISNEVFSYEVVKSKDGDPRSSTVDFKKQNNFLNSKKTITVNNILKKYSSLKYKPFIIKIDIEGHEKHLFKSNTEWVDKFDIIVIELHDWLFKDQEISYNFRQKTLNLDYTTFTHGENTILIRN